MAGIRQGNKAHPWLPIGAGGSVIGADQEEQPMFISSFIKDHSGNVAVVFTDAGGYERMVEIIGWAVTQVGTLRPVIIDPNGKPAVPDSAEDRAAGVTWRLHAA